MNAKEREAARQRIEKTPEYCMHCQKRVDMKTHSIDDFKEESNV